MRCTRSGRSMELDVYIPSLKLAFEYQGEQHFTATPTLDGTPKLLLRDQVTFVYLFIGNYPRKNEKLVRRQE